MVAVQSVSHNLPKLRRLLVKPGIMCPVRACVGMAGNARTAAPVDVCFLAVAVLLVVVGAAWLMCRSGAVGVK